MLKRHARTRNVSLVNVRISIAGVFSDETKPALLVVLVPGPQNTTGETGVSHMYLMIIMWLAIAFLLFVFRPRTLRLGREQQGKSSDQVSELILKRFEWMVFSCRVHVLIVKSRPNQESTRQ